MTRALARNTDIGPSHAAAASVTPHVSALQAKVLETMRLLGHPATAHTIAQRAGLELVTVSPRMRRLCEAGLVREAGFEALAGQRSRTLWALVASEPKQEAAA